MELVLIKPATKRFIITSTAGYAVVRMLYCSIATIANANWRETSKYTDLGSLEGNNLNFLTVGKNAANSIKITATKIA